MIKKVKKIYCSIIMLLFCLTTTAYADSVPWSTIKYTATVVVNEIDNNGNVIFDHVVQNYTLPLPVSAYYSHPRDSATFGTAYSYLSEDSIKLTADSNESTPGYSMIASAQAEIRGNFYANADFLKFSIQGNDLPTDSIGIAVNDETTNLFIMGAYLNGPQADITIPTPKGHNISVVVTTGISYGHGSDYDTAKTASLTYQLSVSESSDRDGDKIANLFDLCNETPVGGIVDPENGCTINQLVPCDGPWQNHGDYVSKIIAAGENYFERGILTKEQFNTIVSDSAGSACGRR